ncbi:hypothetical protein ACFCYI_34195 [Streptomyces sp. NPDC056257]|uniref:hypothetical protein n=1 Tax=Streptomyces sp. NPDC056257 TaxID=3345765 RepID=UPI0035D751D2
MAFQLDRTRIRTTARQGLPQRQRRTGSPSGHADVIARLACIGRALASLPAH